MVMQQPDPTSLSPQTPPEGLDTLTVEILKSERLRFQLLAIVFGVGTGLAGLGYVLVQLVGPTSRVKDFPFLASMLVLGVFALYELGNVRIMDGSLKRQKLLPRFLVYVNALLEVSVPSLTMILTFGWANPYLALSGPSLMGYGLFIATSALRLELRVSVFTGVVAALEYLALTAYSFSTPMPEGMDPTLAVKVLYVERALILLGTGVATGLVAQQIRLRVESTLSEAQERNRVLSLFGQHVSPGVVNKLLSQTTPLGSETRHVAVMFLDIRNFTRFSESRRPEEVIAFLNDLFGFMIEIVNKHNGIINKFLGDGFMAVFGAPFSDGQNSRNAVAASLDILEELQRRIQDGRIPSTELGIGLHCGEAVTGNVGSEQRKEYTVIGDVVNLASRIESLNKAMQSHLLLSAQVKDEAGDIAQGAEPMGKTQVKGREEAVEVFKLA